MRIWITSCLLSTTFNVRPGVTGFLPLAGPSFVSTSKRLCSSLTYPKEGRALQGCNSVRATAAEESTATTSQQQQQQQLRTLYPPLAPYRNGSLVVDDTHTLSYQEYGSPHGITALFLHGGPGAGCNPNHARFFDPDRYRIVLLDQRGSGQSTPRGQAFINNTLLDLVHDCERLRRKLDIAAWDVVLGGSWGTTLAIAYAQEFPSSVKALVLRGLCLLRRQEVDWLFNRHGGAAQMNMEAWTKFSCAVGVDPLADESGRQALMAHYDRLLGEDPHVRLASAKAWKYYEMRITATARKLQEEKQNSTDEALVLVRDPVLGFCCQDSSGALLQHKSGKEASEEILSLRRGITQYIDSPAAMKEGNHPRPISEVPATTPENTTENEQFANFIPAQAMLTCFYSVNLQYALNNIDLLASERMERIRNIPCIAVQGGMDTICPPDTALDISMAWPEMELRIPTTAGHSMYDDAIRNELIMATDRIARGIADD